MPNATLSFIPPAVDELEEDAKFTPPAPDDIDLSALREDPYNKFKLQEAAAAQAGLPLESYSASVPAALNPDWDFTRATHGNPALAIMGSAAKEASHLVAKVAVPVITGIKQAMAPENALLNNPISNPDHPEQWGRADISPVKEGVPMLQLPRLTPAEMEGATPTERALAGMGEGMAGAYESFTTPENIALLPFAAAKPVQAMFATQMAASIPESLQAVADAKTPEEKARAITSLGLNVALSSTLTHSMMKEGVPNASQVPSPEGIPVPEVRKQVGQEAPLRQQGEAAPARATETAQGEVPLKGEYHDLLAPHWDDDQHSFGKLGDNQVMMADHATGKVIVDPEQFQAFVDNDLKGMDPTEKAAAVKSLFDEEDIHLKTDPEDADRYEASLSPIEKRIFTRNYMRGSTEALSPRNLGFEVIRKRVQQAKGMTPNEFIGLALKERWTAKALDALGEAVAKIRRLKDRELNDHQKAILDKVMGNIDAAKNALTPQSQTETADEQQYVEGPFGRRQAELEKDKVQLTRESTDVDSPAPVHDLDEKVSGLLMRKPGETTVQDIIHLSDVEAQRFFEGNQKRGNAIQHDAVLAGMKLGVESIPELTKMRDRMHQVGMQKLEKAFGPGGDGKAPTELGKVIWLNGALEGAAREGPNYESVVTRRREEGPAARRRGDKGDINQEKLFGGPITQKGIPGEEPTPEQHASAFAVGAREVPPEQKIFPKDLTFDPKQYGSKSLPFRQITASEAKNSSELSKFLTADARKEGSDLPVSMSKRLTVLFDKTDGSVHMVSTYRGDNIARMVDPEKAGMERNSRPIDELLHRYQPVASVLLAEPRQGFHQKFQSMADFQTMFGDEAMQMAREQSTGTEGIPMTSMGKASAVEPEFSGGSERYGKATPSGGKVRMASEGFRYPKEREPNLPRPTVEELKAFHDFFGDTPPSDAHMFSRRIEREAATASRTMINGLRKLVRIERAQTRSLSEGEAIGRVLDRLYENFKDSETRSEFVARTTEQGNFGAPKEIPPRGEVGKTGARELTHLRDVAPTTDRSVKPGTGAPEPELPEPKPVEMLTEEEQKVLNEEIRKHHPPQFEVSPRTTLGKQVLETPVPKEPYTIGKSKSIQEEGKVSLEETPPELQSEIFPSREIESEAPEEAEAGESLAQEKKAVARGEGNKAQLDFWKQQGPAARRRAAETVDKIKEFLEQTGKNISTAGDLSDQLNRLKTGEKADYDLALPVVKSAIKIIPEGDRATLLKYADEMQVMKHSDIKLTDAQDMMYQTFIKPLLDDNQRMYTDLVKAGVPVGESTYLGRLVQDTQSLYARLWRGTKQRVVEGSVLGQGASFFKRRVFKAIEDNKGERSLVALIGTGRDTRVIKYTKGKPEMLGKMPPESLKAKPLTLQQIRTQRVVEARRLQEINKLDKEEQALLREQDRLEKAPQSAERDTRLQGVNERLSSLNADYTDVNERFPTPQFEVPRMWVDKNGKLWKFTDATVSEIEGNTNTRYYKEPVSGVITQNLKLKQIYRANQFLTSLKESPEFQRVSRGVNERNIPEDWRTVDLQQLRGLRIEPRVADVLDLFAQEQRGPSLPFKYLNNLNQFLRNALFVWNPLVHEPNLLTHWFTARGIEWAKPVGYDRMFKSGAAALNDVMTRSRFRDEALRAGAPLMRGMGNMNRQILNLLRKELDANPSMATKIGRALGYINPLRMIRAFGDSLTWGTNEILTLQLIRETMQRTGLNLEDAITEVGKHMPNYRVPPRVLNSRLISQVMRNPMLSLWGHYHYGALRSYGEMGKEILSPSSSMSQRIEGLGRVASIGFLMALVYPTIDDIVNKVLHTKSLKMRRAGSTTAPSNIIDLLQGKKTPEAVAQSIVTPSPVPIGAVELAFNRNLRSGLPIYERRLGTQTLKDLAAFGASKVSPVEEAGKVFGGKKSGQEFGLGLAGITRTRADSAMSQFGRLADDWMRHSPDEAIREQYKRRTQDVFPESDYQLLRSAVIREDYRAGQMAMEKLLKNRKPTEVMQRIKQWQDSPFTGTRKTDHALMEQMTPEDWDLWYQAAQERLDIADGMKAHLVDAITKPKE